VGGGCLWRRRWPHEGKPGKGYQMLLGDSTVDMQEDYIRRMRLPASLAPADGKKCWAMGGLNLKKKVAPATPEKEAEVVLTLLKEIRSKMAIDLDAAPMFHRKVNTEQIVNIRRERLYLVVGGSDAELLTEAMRRKGNITDAVMIPNWKVGPELVEILIEKMKLAIARRKPDCIIVQCMDDSVFFSLSEDDSILPAKKGEDGKVHIEGRVVLCKGEVLEMVLRRLDPLWEATKGIDTVAVIPMVRYVMAGCYDDSNHVKNRTEPGYLTKMRKDLEEFRISLKRHLHGSGQSHCQVMDPSVDLMQLEARHAWGEDPVHPTALAFDKMVTGIKAIEVRIKEEDQSRGDERSKQVTAAGRGQ
jgi:hypothetical protein